tara:strand:+ start:191 stop:439 length:249 start_codon:yes stop_codon:yes gene_type:complete
MRNLLIVLLLFFSFNTISKEKKDNIKPLKVNKKVEKKGDYVIIRTETIFTKSQWKELKDQTKKNKSLLKKRDKSLSAVQKNL